MILTLLNNSMLHSSGFCNFTINLIKSVECQCKFHVSIWYPTPTIRGIDLSPSMGLALP